MIYTVWIIVLLATTPSDVQQYGKEQHGVWFFTSPQKCDFYAADLYEHQPTRGRYLFKCVPQMNSDAF